jgi:hypothetical protein
MGIVKMAKYLSLPSTEYLHELFRYDAVTGELYWKIRLSTKASLDKPAGRIDTKDGYIQIGFHGKVYRRSRIVWALFNSDPGKQQIDHINRLKWDDRIENLRIATPRQNSFNKLCSTNKSGCPGVRKTDSNKWRAEIRLNGRIAHLGIFKDFEDAKAAYIKASLDLHQQFSVFNSPTPCPSPATSP